MKLQYLGLILLAIGLGPVNAAPSNPTHWSYTSPTGPDEWGDLYEGYALCSAGKLQSPINIKANAPGKLPALKLHYPARSTMAKHNGYSLEVTSKAKGYVTLKSETYHFVQLDFHAPAEEQIDGHKYPFSANLIHRDKAGNLAVITLLFEVGAKNLALAPLFASMPRHKGDAIALGSLDLVSLFPAKRDYFTYMGSLTTPPCTEGIRWLVLKMPGTLSQEQLQAFKVLFPMNARPIQPTNDRRVQFGG